MSADRPADPSAMECPIPIQEYPRVLLAHGGGGRMTQMLIERFFLEAFRNPALEDLHDGARLDVDGARLAFSTDSFVVQPLFFPGGDIGSLAVHGTGFILEEGLPVEDLWRITASMGAAAREVGVPIVTGDTKVVDRGKGDGIFINTAGIGSVPAGVEIAPGRTASSSTPRGSARCPPVWRSRRAAPAPATSSS